MNHSDLDLIDRLHENLVDLHIVNSIERAPKYYDEPLSYYFLSRIEDNPLINHSRFFIKTDNIVSGGLSFSSPHIASLRALGETVERFSLNCFDKEKIQFFKVRDCPNPIDLHYFPVHIPSEDVLGWVKGEDVKTHQTCFIPAQQLYLTYLSYKKEQILDSLISSGAAAGINFNDTLVKGIYEDIERDAVMIRFLTRSAGVHIDVKNSRNPVIRKYFSLMERYQLEWHLFDMQVDLGIPVYLTVLIDRTGIGPAVTVGSKAHLHSEDGIVASLEEACMSRILARQWMFTNQVAQEEITLPGFHHSHISFWSQKVNLPHIDWLINAPYSDGDTDDIHMSKDELDFMLQKLSQCGYKAYYADITNEYCTRTGIKVTKVIIPGLQALYLDDIPVEDNKFINNKRLQKALGVSSYTLNPVIHPFI
jgi:ribosomal protein S12 methylthiotransferase accessory factor